MTELKKITPAQARVTESNRVPMGVRRLKLANVNIPGYITRWFNDDPQGRINDATNGGWEFVSEAEATGLVSSNVDAPLADLGERVARVVGTNKQGQPIVAYLMKIKREWYEADQAVKAESVAAIDREIREGRVGQKEGDGRYSSGIAYRPK